MAKKAGRGDTSLKSLLDDPSRGITRCGGPSGALSKLFRQIMHDIDMKLLTWDKLMIDYLRDPRNKVPDNRKDQSSMRGNLTKEFSHPNMTLKVFIKAMRFIRARKIRFSVEITHHDGRTTMHATEVELDSPANFVFTIPTNNGLQQGVNHEHRTNDGTSQPPSVQERTAPWDETRQ